MTVARECPDFVGISGIIDIHRQKLKTLRGPTRVQPIEKLQVFLAARRPYAPRN